MDVLYIHSCTILSPNFEPYNLPECSVAYTEERRKTGVSYWRSWTLIGLSRAKCDALAAV